MPFVFKKQPNVGEDAKLCAFYALYHFKNGNIDREQYIASATEYYETKIPDMSPEDAKALVMGGNDPGTLEKFGLKEVDIGEIPNRQVLIVCDVSNGHFFTIRKENGEWWNYNSYTFDEKQKIGTDEAAKKICGSNPIYGSQ